MATLHSQVIAKEAVPPEKPKTLIIWLFACREREKKKTRREGWHWNTDWTEAQMTKLDGNCISHLKMENSSLLSTAGMDMEICEQPSNKEMHSHLHF